MKISSLAVALGLIFIFDLSEAKQDEDFLKEIEFNETFSAVVALNVRENERYFIAATNKEIILFVDYKNRLEKLDSKSLSKFPNFRVENSQIRLLYLPSKDGALLFTDNVDSRPECLLIPFSRSTSRLGHLSPINNDYRKFRPQMEVWNTFRVISQDADNVITAFLNATEVYKTSWIIRQQLINNDLVTSGIAFDHLLPRLRRPHNASQNVYAFEFQGFAYFLRYAYRLKFIDGDQYEWVWQLTRVCTKDESKSLRSRASIPLNCSFDLNQIEANVGWRPTNAYLDRKDGKLYVYVQPNLSKIENEKSIRHRICSYDMDDIVEEFERTFERCFENFSQSIAVHGGASTTRRCSLIRNVADQTNGLLPCRYDICNPEECTVDPFYQTESYTPVYGNLAAVIDFRYQSDVDVEVMEWGPVDMFVTLSAVDIQPATKQAFVRNAAGTLFMIFINDNDDRVVPSSPAWVKASPLGSAHGEFLLETPGQDGLQLVDTLDSTTSTFQADCGLYTDCVQLMQRGSGEQAQRFWSCGWCELSNRSFSALERHCARANGHFHKNACPPRADCYEPREWKSGKDFGGIFKINGYFPSTFGYVVTACGAKCDVTKSNEQQLICALNPDTLGDKDASNCDMNISIISLDGGSVISSLRPACTAALPSSYQNSGGRNYLSWLFAALSLAVAACIVVYVFTVCRRRRRKRQRSGDSATFPMATVLEISRSNDYVVQRRDLASRWHPPAVRSEPRRRESFLDMVPPQKLLRSESIELVAPIGSGHFGKVYKAHYFPKPGVEILVAAKTLKAETDSRKFLKEAAIMGEFDHPHVLSLVGITFDDDNVPYIIMPFMPNGDLHSYISNQNNKPTMHQLLQFGLEVSKGVQYLHHLKIVHRDLAARNCMLDDELHVKVADFGLSREVYESEIYLSTQRDCAVPVPWMPLETLARGEFTLKSDVWSYGVVLWELMTRGEVPYSPEKGMGILSFLKSGQRLAKPFYCPDAVYEIMRLCWTSVPLERPDIASLSLKMADVIFELNDASFSRPVYYNDAIVAQQMVTTA